MAATFLATSASCDGRTMRTAMSASRCSRSSTLFEGTSSITSSGCASRSAASRGGSTSTLMTSLAVRRTVPRTPSPWLLATRRSAAAVADRLAA